MIRITRLTNTTFSNFISGQCLEAVILGALFAIAMAILKLPYIALVSVIISVTALIPLVGAFIGCALGCFFILVESPMQALTFLDENPQLRNWVIEYTNLENIDWPSLVQKVIAFISERISKVFNGAFSAIGSVTSSIFNAFLSIVFAFYVLSRKEILSRQGRRLMYAFFSEKTADQVIRITRLTRRPGF